MNKLIHPITTSIAKYCGLVVLIVSVSSCQSTMKDVGEKHKTVAAKWYALANYAESDIRRYGVTITGQLAVDVKNPKQQFKLNHFKLSLNESVINVNLLAPTFENKYICIQQCYQLLEYINFSGESGTTLLTRFFSEHEFELFKFYGDVQILNEQLKSIAKTNKALLSAYLKHLSYQDNSFTTAKEFTQYLSNVLTMKKFNEFVLNPTGVYDPFLKNFKMEPDIDWSVDTDLENKNWGEPEAIESKWLINGSPELEAFDNESSNLEAPWLYNESNSLVANQKFTRESEDDLLLFNDLRISKNNHLWQEAKRLSITLGKNVCSFQENYFGVVTSLSATGVVLDLLGQAKVVTEGLISEAPNGALFTSASDIYFLPQSGQKPFSRSDVAICYLE